MVLHSSGGEVYHAHFRHRHFEPRIINGHEYNAQTECNFHKGPCSNADRPCGTPNTVTAVARRSVLDHFNRRRGHLLAFQRALELFGASKELERELFEQYWQQIPRPRANGRRRAA